MSEIREALRGLDATSLPTPIVSAILFHIDSQAERIAALTAECEALRRDAERYRWLREGDNDEIVLRYPNGEPIPVEDPDWTVPAFLLRNEKLDEAIDAARQQEATNANG